MARPTMSVVSVAAICAHASFLVSANVFLAKDHNAAAGEMSKAEVQGILFEQIRGFFGQDSAKSRVAEVEDLMRPLYVSLPKDLRGSLGHGTIRYALHRYFLQQHAWHIKGLEPTGGAWNETNPTSVLKNRVPLYIHGLFDEYLGERGFGLHELAVLATALEYIVKTETVARIEAAYSALNHVTGKVLQADAVDAVLDMNQLVYLLSIPFDEVSKMRMVIPKMNKVYPGWKDTQAFVRDTRGNLAYAEKDRTNPFITKRFDFQQVVHTVETIHDQFGHFQDIECRETKSMLLEMEVKSTGRLRLSDFYGLALGGDMRFSEPIDYLRQLGALDESDPGDLRLIASNYMYGINNCFESSSYYSVCCLDECNPLLEHLERTFAASEANPGEIARVVSHLSSSTVVAPRNLSGTLLRKLDDISTMHGGMVPLHGRMFMQFMHHAFPRECPHPHLSGTTTPKSASDYKRETGKNKLANKDELRQYGKIIDRVPVEGDSELGWDASAVDMDEGDIMPWSVDEELLAERVLHFPDGPSPFPWLRLVVMMSAVASLGYGLVKRVQDAQSAVRPFSEGKHFV